MARIQLYNYSQQFLIVRFYRNFPCKTQIPTPHSITAGWEHHVYLFTATYSHDSEWVVLLFYMIFQTVVLGEREFGQETAANLSRVTLLFFQTKTTGMKSISICCLQLNILFCWRF